ncbi:universal stress protein [Adhaeretor mobilis]|uniref:Universal stress protein n=1 Tax=Adhaeretor mobilis TaxID=1930276 RepID=A0A517MZF5_9BACT|nr:universal stress protein [Adhaeretor mobilis]QDT00245.1 Putative universal stress protein [Adhaeretor mobilis]
MNWFEGKKLLVPIDFSENSHRALDTALGMGTDVCAVNVGVNLSVTSPESVWGALTEQSQREHIKEAFWKNFADERYRGIDFRVSFGDPGYEIASLAEEIGADVIVMPSHGRTGIKRILLGSVAERVLRLAHCPVLVLRH